MSFAGWKLRKATTLAPILVLCLLLLIIAVFVLLSHATEYNSPSFISSTPVVLALTMASLGIILTVVSVVDISRLFNALQLSQQHRLSSQENERRLLAQDLHDDVLQQMIDLKRNYTPEKVDQIIIALRRNCQHLKPLMLEELGLSASLHYLIEDFKSQNPQTQIHYIADDLALNTLENAYQISLFRILQEALQNIKRHAQANQVNVIISYSPQESHWLRVKISDNGCGVDVKTLEHQKSKGHLGFVGIQERVHDLGGKFEWVSRPKFLGTQINAMIPTKRKFG
ncbi:MAG: ATP-binding protein [Vampirovibrionales bacterium]|nr:ATP-binding protein [Vampirovibrionales bacterium]